MREEGYKVKIYADVIAGILEQSTTDRSCSRHQL